MDGWEGMRTDIDDWIAALVDSDSWVEFIAFVISYKFEFNLSFILFNDALKINCYDITFILPKSPFLIPQKNLESFKSCPNL